MTRVQSITLEKATPEVKGMLEGIQKKMGKLPNIFQNMGNSPAVLKAYLELSGAAGSTSFSPTLREQIALVVGQANHCNYCLSAHSAIGKSAGLTDEQILQARKGHSSGAKEEAILHFAKAVVDKKGEMTASEVEALKKAGVSDKELVELILVISLNMFTNYFNHITDPVIDFPVVSKTP
jgi:uncharacterized peroxidase-related enzyme